MRAKVYMSAGLAVLAVGGGAVDARATDFAPGVAPATSGTSNAPSSNNVSANVTKIGNPGNDGNATKAARKITVLLPPEFSNRLANFTNCTGPDWSTEDPTEPKCPATSVLGTFGYEIWLKDYGITIDSTKGFIYKTSDTTFKFWVHTSFGGMDAGAARDGTILAPNAPFGSALAFDFENFADGSKTGVVVYMNSIKFALQRNAGVAEPSPAPPGQTPVDNPPSTSGQSTAGNSTSSTSATTNTGPSTNATSAPTGSTPNAALIAARKKVKSLSTKLTAARKHLALLRRHHASRKRIAAARKKVNALNTQLIKAKARVPALRSRASAAQTSGLSPFTSTGCGGNWAFETQVLYVGNTTDKVDQGVACTAG
jgi:hypothetical protein